MTTMCLIVLVKSLLLQFALDVFILKCTFFQTMNHKQQSIVVAK